MDDFEDMPERKTTEKPFVFTRIAGGRNGSAENLCVPGSRSFKDEPPKNK